MIPGDQLAILYSPGARGDFLAAVLLDKLTKFEIYSQMTIQVPVDYKKIHTLPCSKFESQYTMSPRAIGRHTSIRIKLSDIDDLLNVAYFCCVKLPKQYYCGLDVTLNYLTEQELLFRQFDSVFGHVVEFKDLFDIESIKQLYYKINQQQLSTEYINNICYNIKLQTRVNRLNYTKYFSGSQDLLKSYL